jgi:hypothetical protein
MMAELFEEVKDLMNRTMFNLEFVQKKKSLSGPYEVTQLVNSFLGAMAYPWEKKKEQLRQMLLDEAERRGWPVIVTQEGSLDTPKSLGDLIRVMRNAMAHGNLDFESRNGEIVALRLWNRGGGEDTWRARVKVNDLRRFLTCFVGLANELYNNPPP